MNDSNQEPAAKGWDSGYWLTLVLGIGLVVFWGPLVGFYMGTVFGHDYHAPRVVDLQHADIMNGVIGAGIGALVGLAGLITILVVYPSRTKKDYEDWKEEFSRPHFNRRH